jgi:hypothetical protein
MCVCVCGGVNKCTDVSERASGQMGIKVRW